MTLAHAADTATAQPLLNRVLDSLGQKIVSGEMPPGEVFTLKDVSNQFGISRTVAREAMRALEHIGLVSSSRRVGITVLPPSRWNVLDAAVISWRAKAHPERQATELSELCYGVLPVAASLAAQRADPLEAEEVLRLADTLARLAERSDDEAFAEANEQFHAAVLSASKNEMFRALAPTLFLSARRDTAGAEGVQARRALAAAIAGRDPEGAESSARLLTAPR